MSWAPDQLIQQEFISEHSHRQVMDHRILYTTALRMALHKISYHRISCYFWHDTAHQQFCTPDRLRKSLLFVDLAEQVLEPYTTHPGIVNFILFPPSAMFTLIPA